MIEKNTKELKKEIRDKEKQISEYQEIAIKNQEIAEITREELDNTQKENEAQKQIISKQQDDIENFVSQKELEKKKTMTLVINTQPVMRKVSSGTMEMNETTPMKKTVVEIEEKSTDCQKTRDDNQTRNTTKQRNRHLIEVLYCFAINWLNKKLYKKIKNEQIENIIKATNINVNNEKEYIKYIKISHKIKENTKQYIKVKINDIIEGRVECNSIIKNIILKNNSTEINEEYLNTLINKIKEMKVEKCSNINYYFQRKETDKLIMEINNRWVWSGSRIDYLQDDMDISMIMHLYLQNKIIGDKFDEIKEILKKINRLEDLVKGRKWYRIKCIMKLKENDEEGIKVKALERIKYLKYMMTMIKERIKFNKEERVRINTNKIMFDSNKKIRIRKKDPKNEIYQNNDITLE
ncbi:hypothetical protein, conserved [Entamoeba histolytica]